MSWARTAWAYFAPGVGVNPTTGLHTSNLGTACFTDWDLAGYILAIIYAEKLGLITLSGTWQFNDRIQKVLNFLLNRPLFPGTTSPYHYYSSDAINPYQPCTLVPNGIAVNVDGGRLLASLSILETFSGNTYTSEVNDIFQRSKSTYDGYVAAGDCSGADYYAYLMAEGLRAFGYTCATFSAIDNYAGPYIPVNGQSLPELNTIPEPLNLEILTEHPSARFLDFANRVYLAQEARWNGGNEPLTAWSEGGYSTLTAGPFYIYEWLIVQLSPGNWQTWTIATSNTAGSVINIPPIAFTKVAFSYLAIYGENSYTDALVNAAKTVASSTGFGEGTFENGQSAISSYSYPPSFYTDKTQEQVLEAAAYAISHLTTFDTNPTSFVGTSTPGSISACGGTFTEGQSSNNCGGSFVATANLPSPSSGWQIGAPSPSSLIWSWTGGISCSSSTTNPTTCTFTSEGSLTATFAAQVTFTVAPASAVIGWGSCAGPNYHSGDMVYLANFGSVTACYYPTGYSVSSWTCSGGLSCTGSGDPTPVSFTGPGAITLTLKTGSLTSPVSTMLTASATPPTPGSSVTVSGTLTPNGGDSSEPIVCVLSWSTTIVTVNTNPAGSYTCTATAPTTPGTYNVDAFFLGDYGTGKQYLPSKATATITVT
jgi:hypothetical protein